jgi:hypothetical protein
LGDGFKTRGTRGGSDSFRTVTAGLAGPLGSSTAAESSVRHNQGLKARPHALNPFGPSFQGEASPVPVCRAANLLDQSLEAGAVLIAD